MRVPQSRQWPRSKSQERIGTLSRARISVPQPGQRERGRTIDSPFGTRWITTFKKLPITAPSGMAVAIASTAQLPGGSSRQVFWTRPAVPKVDRELKAFAEYTRFSLL